MKQISCESGLVATLRPASVGHVADGGLLHLAEGEEGVGELVLRQAEEEVGLVFDCGRRGGRGSSGRVAESKWLRA